MKDELLKQLLIYITNNPNMVKSFKTRTKPYATGDKEGLTNDYEIEFFEQTPQNGVATN